MYLLQFHSILWRWRVWEIRSLERRWRVQGYIQRNDNVRHTIFFLWALHFLEKGDLSTFQLKSSWFGSFLPLLSSDHLFTATAIRNDLHYRKYRKRQFFHSLSIALPSIYLIFINFFTHWPHSALLFCAKKTRAKWENFPIHEMINLSVWHALMKQILTALL